MKKVAIVGLGWLGMPLALSLTARGWQVTGSKTTQDGVEAARMCGIDSYPLRLEPQLVSVAGIYRTTETELPADVRGNPAQVRLDGEKLLIEPL